MLAEILLLQMLGLNLDKMINVPTWYLSVLLFGGFLIIYFLKNHKKMYYEFAAPLFIVILISWFYRKEGYLNHSTLDNDVTTGIYWNRPLFLGLMLMMLGTMLFYFNNRKAEGRVIKNRGSINILIEVVCLIVPVILAVKRGYSQWDFLYVAMMAVGIQFSLQNERLAHVVKGKVGAYLLRLSWPVYLNHNMFRLIIPEYIGFSLKSYVIYLVLVILYSMLTMSIVEQIERKGKKRWKKQLQQ